MKRLKRLPTLPTEASWWKREITRLLRLERRRCAAITSQFSLRPDASIYPGVPFAAMNESAKTAAHTTAQQIASAILNQPEEGKR